MDNKKQQTVLLGVTGSIAAYKACELLRLLQKAGVRVKVIMTEHAEELVGAATFRALSGEPVATNLFEDPSNPINHISLGEEADVLVIAPCTANVINKLANGVADDLLTTTVLATTAPLVVAPAMNVLMLQNDTTQESLKKMEARGAIVVGPGKGYLACGDEDSGRMSEPEEICKAVLGVLKNKRSLEGKKVMITAGPTREFLDPVRFISSPSSGRTGYAIAKEAAARGAEVVLVSGPSELAAPKNVELISVVTAVEMLAAAKEHFATADLAIFSAAVADFRPAQKADQKLKKGVTLPAVANAGSTADDATDSVSRYSVEFESNPDILATLAASRNKTAAKSPFVVGFAAETEDLLANAQQKLYSKGADLIIANDVSDPELGFASTHNRLLFVSEEECDITELMSKDALAGVILDTVMQKL